MKLRGPVPDEILSAHVDGALDAQTAAELATRALADPALAARIARLHGLKAGVAGLADALPPAPPLPAPPRRSRAALVARLRAPGAALAAGLAAAALLLALSLVPAPNDRMAAGGALGAHHDAWARSPQTESPRVPGWLTDAMAEAGLRLVHVAALPQEGLLHMAFIGRNDCRISLFERPWPGAAGPVDLQVGPELLQASWQTDQAAFTLIARSMNAERFTTIAEALAAASTRRDAAPDPGLIAGLRAARQPCLG